MTWLLAVSFYRWLVLPHWETAIAPLLEALARGPIVEIGAASGETTERLAPLAASLQVVLHVVEPEPEFDVDDFERRFGEGFRFHRERSHEALEKIGPAAAVLIDGDHNWYTVHGELTRLEEIAAAAGRDFPLILLHDVEWPYARRDMYYDPDAVPAQWRQPWQRRGIRWGQPRLAEDERGVNGHLANAIEEGGPRNGVLTAVEDFVAESELPLELRTVHGEAGLGVLASHELLAAAPDVRRTWDHLVSPEFLLEQTRRLAEVSARAIAGNIAARDRFERLNGELERVKGELAEARRSAECA